MALTAKQIEELNVAAARRTAGTAGATDIANLDYATKTYGYKAPTASSDPAVATPKTMTVEKWTAANTSPNSTLSGIANANKTTVDEILKLNPNIKDRNLIYTGQNINLPGNVAGSGAEVPDYSNVNSVADANAKINEDQQKDAGLSGGVNASDVPTRKTTADIMADIQTQVTPDKDKPTADFTGALEGYRTEYGVAGLETQLDQLRAQEQEQLAQKDARVTAQRGKGVALNVVAGRIGEIERQENERIAVIQRSISNATNQLNTKYNIINSLMKTKEMDYNAATDTYDKEMNTNIQLFNAAKGIEESQKDDIERAQDTARSNAQIILNAYNEAGTTYAELPEVEKTNLTKMGVQSGLGADFFTNVLKAGGEKSILTTIKSDDDTKVSIIYKDGTSKTIATGLPAKAKSGSTLTATEKKQQQLEADRMAVQGDVGSITGEDFKVNPGKIIQVRQNIALNNPELLTWFDNAYEPNQMLNPTYYPSAVRNNSWQEAVKEDERKNKATK